MVDVEYKCGHKVTVPFSIEKGEHFAIGVMVGRAKAYNCPECGRRNAEANVKMLEDIVSILDPGRIERRKATLKKLFTLAAMISGFEKMSLKRRFDGGHTTRFVGHKESANRRISLMRWF